MTQATSTAKSRIGCDALRKAFLIREVEARFLKLFSEGLLNGTVHTCVGQEMSAVAVAGQLEPEDFVFSNHRCHGHYIAFTGDHQGLIAELLGKAGGTCGGIGSSQHLCRGNFYSNGVQGGIVPVAAGLALHHKLEATGKIGAVFIGDGTLGEGAVYESFNLVSRLGLPLLIVCEDNGIAQSTPQPRFLAGEIVDRPKAFGIETFSGTTDDPEALMAVASKAIGHVRETGAPGFLHVRTNRLNPHSKGDDTRSKEEVDALARTDYLIRLAAEDPDYCLEFKKDAEQLVDEAVSSALEGAPQSVDEYAPPPLPSSPEPYWEALGETGGGERLVRLINGFFRKKMEADRRVVQLGEDIHSPYGGAFKVTQDLSGEFPDRVISTPISEAAITGVANGLALAGHKPFVEIMFGDFVTLAIDQVVNHASKFHHMYNRQVTCPVVLRTPMGGGRGYGPTHSQTLDKLVSGIDNVRVVALTSLMDPAPVLNLVCAEEHPVVLIENKVDYGRRVGANPPENYLVEVCWDGFPVLRYRPRRSSPDVTILTYGGIASTVIQGIPELFLESEVLAEVIVFTQISPFVPAAALASVRRTRHVVTVEEGSIGFGFGSEAVSALNEAVGVPLRTKRIGAAPVPIPSPPGLEKQILPSPGSICQQIATFLDESNGGIPRT